jgi:predicted RNA-binding protein YlxR (DUF448 family)
MMAKKTKQARRKHIPVRTCVICRQALPKRSLYRIVQVPERGLVVDLSGKMRGRGAYLCSKATCWEKATAREDTTLSRALRTVVSEEEKAALLAQWVQELNPEREQRDKAAG